MTTADPVSGVVVRVPLPSPLERLRRHDDFAAKVGVPAHVTLLFPFMPAAALRPPVRRALAEIAATVEPFEVRFAAVDRFPGVVYLVPEPAATFTALTDAIAARFPAYQPYEGAFDVVIPHLTLVESADGVSRRDRGGRPAAPAVHASRGGDGGPRRRAGRALARTLADHARGAPLTVPCQGQALSSLRGGSGHATGRPNSRPMRRRWDAIWR